MILRSEYISVFKIDGEPIIPPLMTKEKRHEMLIYKKQAMALEKVLKVKGSRKSFFEQNIAMPSKLSDNIVNQNKSTISRSTSMPFCRKICSPQISPVLEKSDTFIYDIKNNTVIIPQVVRTENEGLQSRKSSSDSSYRTVIDSRHDKIIQENCRTEILPNIQPLMNKNIIAANNNVSQGSSNKENVKCYSSDINKSATIDSNRNIQMSARKSCTSPVRPNSNVSELDKTRQKFEDLNSCISKPKSITSPETPESIKKTTAFKSTETLSRKFIEKCEENAIDVQETPKLIRSNSFTLEHPSPVLLKHLSKNRSQNFKSAEHLVDYEALNICQQNKTIPNIIVKPVKKIDQNNMDDSKEISSRNIATLVTNSTLFKNRKSPYEIKLINKTKILKKTKNPIKKVNSTITIKAKPQAVAEIVSKPLVCIDNSKGRPKKNAENIEKLYKTIENQHRNKFFDLMKQQQEEQKRMQESFERQQKMLIQQLNADISNLNFTTRTNPLIKVESTASNDGTSTRTCSPTIPIQPPNITNTRNPPMDPLANALLQNYLLSARQSYVVSDNSSIQSKSPQCSRRLFNNRNDSPPDEVDDNDNTTTDNSIDIQNETRQFFINNRKIQAATIINSYSRGYLVRRLFKTDYVQRIVQTIRDTLLFVLDLHDESENDESEENFNLKVRLLQQLTSASHTLHNIFCELNTHERMSLIAKDRAYVRAKTQNRQNLNTPNESKRNTP